MIDKIKESRLLFQRKGIMRREFLRNEIALSWARCQVLNVDTEKLSTCPNNRSKKINYKQAKIFSFVDAILIFNENNEMIRDFQRDTDRQFCHLNYDENELGTNGIGLSKNMNRPFYVSGYEHYHQYFFDKLTFGFPVQHQNQTLIFGFVLDLTTKDFLNCQSEIEALALDISNTIQLELPSNTDNQELSLEKIFPGKSQLMIEFKNKIIEFRAHDNHLFLQGQKGSGKELLARCIHENSTRNTQKFYSIYCDKMPTDLLMDKVIQEFYDAIEENREDLYGTIYFEGIEQLSYKTQELLIRLLESKQINSKLIKASISNCFRLIFSSEKSLDALVENKLIHPKLKNRINLFTVQLPELKLIKEDLPILIGQRIEKYRNRFLIDPVMFSEGLMNDLIRYEWPENYRELDKVVEEILYRGRSEKLIDKAFLPAYIKDDTLTTEVVVPLEITEKSEIIKALRIMNNNMALTARALGIGRSTLYRKLDKYNIQI